MIKRIILWMAVAALAAVALLAVDMYRHLTGPLPLESDTVFEVQSGAGVQQVARGLHERGLLERPRYFSLYARLTGLDARLKAGEYRLQAGQSPVDVLGMMERGEVRQYALTIIEGWTFDRLRRALADAAFVEHTLNPKMSGAEVMAALGRPDRHPEGRFYPDTYHFPKGTPDVEILRRAYATMEQTLAREWARRREGLPLDNPDEALILASIIEKETAVPDERPLIAAAFINRLNKGMRLQTDPTVIYGMGEDFDGDIRYRDLRRDTAYNTYTRGGLPPTPIAMPAGASIHAALNPADSDVLYFVSKGDGSHHFSTSLAEHNAAVDRYQRGR
jgi:UPF0755 protein